MKKKHLVISMVITFFLIANVGNSFSEELAIGEEDEYYDAFLRETSILLAPGNFSFDFELSYQSTKRSNILEERRDREVLFDIVINLGIFRWMEVYLDIPAVFRQKKQISLISSNETKDSEDKNGIGDLVFGSKFAIFQEGKYPFSFIGVLGINFPTGEESDFNSLGTGSGHLGIMGGLNFIKSCDPAILLGSISCTYLSENNVNSRRIKPGMIIGCNFGLGFAINDRLTLAGQAKGTYMFGTEVDFVEVIESERELALFEMSAVYAFRKKMSIKPLINFGLNDDTPDFGLAISFSWRL